MVIAIIAILASLVVGLSDGRPQVDRVPREGGVGRDQDSHRGVQGEVWAISARQPGYPNFNGLYYELTGVFYSSTRDV